MRIAFWEPQCRGVAHVQFISCAVRMVGLLHPGADLAFYGEGELYRNVMDEGLTPGMELRECEPPASPAGPVSGKVVPLAGRWRALSRMVRDGAGLIVCLSTTPGVLLLAPLFGVRVRTVLFHHAILEALLRRYRPAYHLFWVGPLLRVQPRYVGNVVLGDSILRNLVEEVPQLEGHTVSVEHPYVFRGFPGRKALHDPPAVGSIGFMDASKGAGLMVRLRAELGDAADVRHVGRLDLSGVPGGSLPSTGGPLGREEFGRAVGGLDWCVFPYPVGSYRMTASGAVLEALGSGVPVVALRTEYFEHLFGVLGDVGILCSCEDELVDVVRNLVEERDMGRYRRMREAIRRCLPLLDPGRLAARLAPVLGPRGSEAGHEGA